MPGISGVRFIHQMGLALSLDPLTKQFEFGILHLVQ